jgi:hypothetical protein
MLKDLGPLTTVSRKFVCDSFTFLTKSTYLTAAVVAPPLLCFCSTYCSSHMYSPFPLPTFARAVHRVHYICAMHQGISGPEDESRPVVSSYCNSVMHWKCSAEVQSAHTNNHRLFDRRDQDVFLDRPERIDFHEYIRPSYRPPISKQRRKVIATATNVASQQIRNRPRHSTGKDTTVLRSRTWSL